MNEENELPPIPPTYSTPFPPFVWLIVAFVPGAVGLVTLLFNIDSPVFAFFLLIVAVVCCLSSGIGLLYKVKDRVTRIVLGVFLGGFFFVLNAIIVIFVGCSQMHF